MFAIGINFMECLDTDKIAQILGEVLNQNPVKIENEIYKLWLNNGLNLSQLTLLVEKHTGITPNIVKKQKLNPETNLDGWHDIEWLNNIPTIGFKAF